MVSTNLTRGYANARRWVEEGEAIVRKRVVRQMM